MSNATKGITRGKKTNLLMLLIIQTFSIFHTAEKKNFCCLQIPITFIVTQCLIFLFLSFHSFRQSLVTIKIKKINIFEKVKKRQKSDNGKESFVQPLRFVSIHCIYLQMCMCVDTNFIYCEIPPKDILSIFTPLRILLSLMQKD